MPQCNSFIVNVRSQFSHLYIEEISSKYLNGVCKNAINVAIIIISEALVANSIDVLTSKFTMQVIRFLAKTNIP